MRKIGLLIFLFLAGVQLPAQNLSDLSYGTDSTFEVVSWNIEWFPQYGRISADSVEEIVRALDVDLFAIQEIRDTSLWRRVVDRLENYETHLKSNWFGGLVWLYNKERVEVLRTYEIYQTASFWSAFPRSPQIMELRFDGEKVVVINNHLKCCGDGLLNPNYSNDQEYRRKEAMRLLEQFIRVYYPEERVILVGDLNDILTDVPEHNVFQALIDNSDSFRFADMDIARGDTSLWSFPSWPSHLDHVLISNEVFEELENPASDIRTLQIENYLPGGWAEYDAIISDHRPVAMKLKLDRTRLDQTPEAPVFEAEEFIAFPNPFAESTLLDFWSISAPGSLEIYNVSGQKVADFFLVEGQSEVRWTPEALDSGIYIAKLWVGKELKAVKKVALLR